MNYNSASSSGRSSRPHRQFQGTRDLKFSASEQAAILYAEASLGHRGQPQAPTAAPGEGFGAFVRFLFALLLLFGLVAVIGHLSDTDFSPGHQPQAATRVKVARGPRRLLRRAQSQVIDLAPQALHVSVAVPHPVSPIAYTNAGDGAAPASGEIAGTGSVADVNPVSAVPEAQPRASPVPAAKRVSVTAVASPADGTTSAEANARASYQNSFGLVVSGSSDSGWRRFSSPDSTSADSGWHTFANRQSEPASVEASQHTQQPGPWKRFKHYCKRRSETRPRHAVRAGDAAEEK